MNPNAERDPMGRANPESIPNANRWPQPRSSETNAVRAWIEARNRHRDAELERAVARGASQYVILGAGLDSIAYPTLDRDLRIFDVDHPATQAWKQARLEEAGIAPPPSLVFVPAWFEEATLGEILTDVGFSLCEISVFSWLGVSPFPSAAAAMAALAFIGSLPSGSSVAFDYAVSRSGADPLGDMAMDALASREREEDSGEPARLLIDSRALHRLLGCAGFGEIEDLGPEEIACRYLAGRKDLDGREPGSIRLAAALVRGMRALV